jgi:hypothetical protein
MPLLKFLHRGGLTGKNELTYMSICAPCDR